MNQATMDSPKVANPSTPNQAFSPSQSHQWIGEVKNHLNQLQTCIDNGTDPRGVLNTIEANLQNIRTYYRQNDA